MEAWARGPFAVDYERRVDLSALEPLIWVPGVRGGVRPRVMSRLPYDESLLG